MMGLQIITTVADMKRFVSGVKASGKTIGLVPTMGALHEGHLTLMRQAKRECDVAVASVFVNPTQFGPNEDFDSYPRTFEADCEKLAAAGVDAVFHPSVAEMYPEGYCTYVTVDGTITAKLCGAKRPGHFRGVATVVTKLINIVAADKAFLGQKDAQQVVVIKRFTSDLNMNVDIVMAPIVREASGLALSSRNQYLSPQQKQAALVLSQSLIKARQAYDGGLTDVAELKKIIVATIQAEPTADIDYVDIYSFPELNEIDAVEGTALAALAVRFGATRLIDNMIIGG